MVQIILKLVWKIEGQFLNKALTIFLVSSLSVGSSLLYASVIRGHDLRTKGPYCWQNAEAQIYCHLRTTQKYVRAQPSLSRNIRVFPMLSNFYQCFLSRHTIGKLNKIIIYHTKAFLEARETFMMEFVCENC